MPSGPRRGLALLLCAALVAPSGAFAQAVRTQTPVVSEPSVPSVPVGAALGALQPLPSSLPGTWLTALPASLPLPPAGALPSAPLSSPDGPVGLQEAPGASPGPVRRTLHSLVQALAGESAAARLFPSFARLGAQSPGALPEAGDDETAEAAWESFREKAGLSPESIPASVAAGFFAPDQEERVLPETAHRRQPGSAARGRRKAPEEPVGPPKYAARSIAFNQTTLPSTAFRPDRPVDPLLAQAVDAAQDSILIAAYEFKSRELLKALRRAKKRFADENEKHKGEAGWVEKKVRIILDFNNVYPSKREGQRYVPHRSIEIQSLLNEGFDIRVVRGLWKYGIMHNKLMVLDGKVAEWGSYNYSWTAEGHHFENANFTDDARRVRGMGALWEYLHGLSASFEEARTKTWPKEVPPPPADDTLPIDLNGTKLPLWAFSPGGAPEDWVVKAIDAAEESVDVSMFAFRSRRIVDALARAAKDKSRKVKVRVLLDKSQGVEDEDGGFDNGKTSAFAQWLAHQGLQVKFLSGPFEDSPEIFSKNHNKFFVVDGKVAGTGSFNWTKNAALMNFDNLQFLDDPTDVSAYGNYFKDMFRKGEAVEAPREEPVLPTDEELRQELLEEPLPLPPAPVWPPVPEAPTIVFNGETFPLYAFRPHHPVEPLLAKAVDAAQESVYIALYEFRLPSVLDALRRAKARRKADGKPLDIGVLIDYSHAFPKGTNHAGLPRTMSPEIQTLIDEGFEVRIVRGDGSTGIMHHKLALFDGRMVEFGSYNWHEISENDHFEGVVFSDEKARVSFYMRLWEQMRAQSFTYEEARDKNWRGYDPEPALRDEDLAVKLHDARFPRTAASPNGGVEDLVIQAIRAARDSIDIAMFSFYSQRVAEELLEALRKGRRIRIVLDDQQSKLMKLDQWFAYYGFDVRIVAGPDPYANVMFQKMHHKFMVVDGVFLEMGSYNYTGNAENNNFENANFFDLAAIVAGFMAKFQMIFDQGWEPFKPDAPPELAPGAAAESFEFEPA